MRLRKYNTATHIYVPLRKAGSNNHAVSADWTPAAGDVKISKDGAAAANVTNLPTAITMGNSAMWDFSLTATEMQAAQIVVIVADAATKAVEDDGFALETYGNASAQHIFDLNVATQSVNVLTWLGSTPNALISGRVDSNVQAIANGILVAATFAAGAFDAVWTVASRLLTAGTNIVLAKGTGVTGFNDLSAAQVNTECDTALSDVGVTGAMTARVDVAVSTRLASASYTAPDNATIAAINAKTTNLPADPADASDIATAFAAVPAAVWAFVVEGTITAVQAMRLMIAGFGGKSSGLDTLAPKYRDQADTKNRINSTTDAVGNRSSTTLDLT